MINVNNDFDFVIYNRFKGDFDFRSFFYDLILVMILNQLNFHDFDFDLKSSQIWFYPTLDRITYIRNGETCCWVMTNSGTREKRGAALAFVRTQPQTGQEK